MKAVILAGGLGTRISEETHLKPKPMIEIGGRPLLWHIMKIYAAHGINDFLICCGYKGYIIKEYFMNYTMHMSDMTVDFNANTITVHKRETEPWRVALIDTGETTQTGGRLLRLRDYLENEETFCFTYGDGLSNVNVGKLLEFHAQHKKLATVTAVLPPGRFGALKIEESKVSKFVEKPEGDGGFINGGFFALSPKVLDFITGDHTAWEAEPLGTLARIGELMAFNHTGFWQPMDTLRDKTTLEEMWNSGKAPWKVWE
jgi:glucose-1-phosphate cytidylyltransferase